MRSAANFKSHPIHPALIPFPIAFLVGAFGFHAAGRFLDRPALWQTGEYLAIAGIASALVAAVPGFIDYFKVVPPNSSGKARATKHMAANLGAVALFAAAVLLRYGELTAPSLVILGIEGAGVALLAMGGWMGGTLVYRNQISVDHRYAEAGKYKDVTIPLRDGEPIVVGRVDELQVDQMKLLRIDDRRIVLARTEDGYVAFDDRCTHKGASLADGAMICGTVQCPWHGSQFNTRTGAVDAGPAEREIATYAVREDDGRLLLDLTQKRRSGPH